MRNIYTIISIVFLLSILAGCNDPKQKTLVVTDYVPANQMKFPNFLELQAAANDGDAIAQYNLGKLYAEGLGVPKNHRMAMGLWKQSANQRYAPAQYALGWMYFNGNGVITDFQEGCKWMQEAAKQGVQEAIPYCNRYCAN